MVSNNRISFLLRHSIKVSLLVSLFSVSSNLFAASSVLDRHKNATARQATKMFVPATDGLSNEVTPPGANAPTPNPTPPPGPPTPSSSAKGLLNIGVIHEELNRIYNDCIVDTNLAFSGNDPEEAGDTTHDHIHEGDTRLKPKNEWRCSAGTGWAGTDWCNDVEMSYDTNCKINKFAVTDEEGFFNCELNNEWYVRLDNYFHYELDFGFSVSRDLYQTAEIRVYCETDGGWGGAGLIDNLVVEPLGGRVGEIKVVHLPPIVDYGRPGFVERSLPPVKRAVINGLQDQYLGKVDKMRHIIDVEGLSGSPCASLGIDGDDSIPLANRNIIWDIPQGPPVLSQ